MIGVLFLSAISACLYRAGGLSKEEKHWIPVWARHSWVRDWLCPLCMYILFVPQSWYQLTMWVLCYGATGGFLSTYWDWLFKYDNYWFSGFMVGLAGLFLIALGLSWQLLLLRAFILAISWGAWCTIFSDADVEEYGRGAFLVLTMLTLGV